MLLRCVRLIIQNSKNQNLGALVQEIRNHFYNTATKRIKFTKSKRQELYIKFDKKCNCCAKELNIKETHIDHIKPLAGGGTNDELNLQILCKECHFEKTQEEQHNHEYVKTSETKSSYNSQVFDIINSSSASVKAFCETFNNYPNKKKNELYTILI